MSNIEKGRFNENQVACGLIEDVVSNEHVQDVICICAFKDGSLDVYGSMSNKDLAMGLKVIDHNYLNYSIEEMS